MNGTTTNPIARRLVAVKRVASYYPDANMTESSVRWLLFNAKDNGFGCCVVRLGRKILIDLDKFEEWMDTQAIQGGAI